MLDIPTHQITTTFDVGGNPRFIITGLNPPVFAPNPQQARTLQNVLTVVAYVIVAALLVVPIILFRRYAKVHHDNLADEGQELDQHNKSHDNAKPESQERE